MLLLVHDNNSDATSDPLGGACSAQSPFSHISLQGRIRSSLPHSFPAPVSSIFTCVYPHSANVWGDPFNMRMNHVHAELLLLVGVSCFSLGKSEKEKEKELP